MNRKAFGILVAVACLFVVLAIIGQGPSDTRSIAGDLAGRLLFPNLTDDLESIDRILIEGAGRKRLVTLERSPERWTVVELDGYEAETGAVVGLLIDLAEARIAEERTSDPAFHSRLGVESIDDPEAAGVELTLVAADGDRYPVVLGSAYGGGQRHARVADEDLSVLIDRNPDVGEDPSDWVAAEIVDISADRVQRVEIRHADGETLAFSKAARGETNFTVEDIPEGRELQYAGVANATASLLDALRLDDVRLRPDETEETIATTEFSTFDGLIVTVTATGGQADEDPWLTFSARFDTEQALAFATGPVASELADAADDDPVDPDTMAQAEAIDARLAGWQYRIPSYQLNQLTRRMEDLLRPADDE